MRDLVRIGKVVRAIGLHGHVGVAGTQGALARLERVALAPAGGDPAPPTKVLEARPQGRLWAVRLEDVSDREGAEALVGQEVLASRADLGDADEGSYWWVELEGLPVVTVQGAEVGKVTGLYETGAVDVLVVTGLRGEVLIPLAPYVTVDRVAGRVVVDPPEGLLDLATPLVTGEGGPRRGE
jgi:16S rRNA processing protein RimM